MANFSEGSLTGKNYNSRKFSVGQLQIWKELNFILKNSLNNFPDIKLFFMS